MSGLEHIFLIGAMKSGTTTLYRYLEQHPQIAQCVSKEPEYFSIHMGKADLKKGDYLDLFELNQDGIKFTLDGSTGYTKYPAESGVPERIKAYGIANPHFIYILRNPFDRIESHYNFMKSDPKWEGSIDSDQAVAVSNYYLQLQQYERVFGKDRILLVDFEDLKKDPDRVCKQVFEFIGADAFDLKTDSEAKNKTEASNRKKEQILHQASSVSGLVPRPIKTIGKYFLKKLYPPKIEKLSQKQKLKVHSALLSDMKKLEIEYNFDVGKWGF